MVPLCYVTRHYRILPFALQHHCNWQSDPNFESDKEQLMRIRVGTGGVQGDLRNESSPGMHPGGVGASCHTKHPNVMPVSECHQRGTRRSISR
jgi:hypothetical protein